MIFDFETTSKFSHLAEITQIGAIAVDNRTLRPLDTFKTMVKPHDIDGIEDKALEVTGFTRQQFYDLSEAHLPEAIWPTFVEWVQGFNRSANNNAFNAPIPVGYNIVGYDMPILRKYCQKYGPWDDKRQDQKLLSQFGKVDVMDIVWLWLEHSRCLPNMKLSTIAEHFGVPKEIIEDAHDALTDCRICEGFLVAYLQRLRGKLKECGYMKDFIKGYYDDSNKTA
jgi:DNA polymerase III epsilon subunit-like protein